MFENFMQAAVEVAQEARTPFGATLVNADGQVLTAANDVGKSANALRHAEMNVLHLAFQSPEFKMKGLSLYSTGEPCPMCAGAAAWAGVEKVYWGLSIAEISQYFKQLTVTSSTIFESAWRPMKSQGGILREPCLKLFEDFTHDWD